MRIEVSDGEIVDKYSILCLKTDQIHEDEKKKQVLYEKGLIHEYAVSLINKCPLYYELLYYVNQTIWNDTNEMKTLSMENKDGFAILAHRIFTGNDRRFRLKRIFNTHSIVKEQKSYTDKVLYISVPDKDTLFNKLDELIYMVLEYDRIEVQCQTHNVIEIITTWIPSYLILFQQEIKCGSTPIHMLHVPDITALSIIHKFTLQNYKPVE